MLALTREEMREVDRRAIEDYGIPGVVLMENAGRGAAAEALKMLSHPGDSLVWILCGKGNNGGDGFVIARHLHNAGVNVQVALTLRVDECAAGSGAAATNFRIIQRMGLPLREVLSAPCAQELAPDLAQADLVVDALLGTGLSGAVREPALALINVINDTRKPVLAVDIPSGLCSNTGKALGAAVKAAVTTTFAAAKKGFFHAQGQECVGRLVVVDIGVPREVVGNDE